MSSYAYIWVNFNWILSLLSYYFTYLIMPNQISDIMNSQGWVHNFLELCAGMQLLGNFFLGPTFMIHMAGMK